ncbi:UNVERIFIED_CONTAM: putative mitochondrial protein [Sesamum radiatum]|uniref:Mitochondrial protein n=1 Tax=Sesamum radiatum TaxID=300843 RepID=A0AAW2LD43_SESRA
MCRPTIMGGLGFRSLNFNLALLAKQGWRLLTQPNTILSRVLKAKYFPHCSFWEASKGSRPSLTWRSLLATKEILREGCGVQNEEDAQDGTQFIWTQGSKGLFLVKSAYELVTELEARTEASTSGSYPQLTEGVVDFWHQLWNIPIPPRVCLQAWRVLLRSSTHDGKFGNTTSRDRSSLCFMWS